MPTTPSADADHAIGIGPEYGPLNGVLSHTELVMGEDGGIGNRGETVPLIGAAPFLWPRAATGARRAAGRTRENPRGEERP